MLRRLHKRTQKSGVRSEGVLDFYDGTFVQGWAKCEVPDAEVDVYVNGSLAVSGVADLYRQDLFRAGVGKCAFAIPLDLRRYCQRSEQAIIDVCFHRDNRMLQGSPLVVQPAQIEYELNELGNGRYRGWIRDVANPDQIHNIYIEIDGEVVAEIFCNNWVEFRNGESSHVGFEVDSYCYSRKGGKIQFFSADRELLIPISYENPNDLFLIKEMMQAQIELRRLLSDGNIRNRLMPSLMGHLRGRDKFSSIIASNNTEEASGICVVIPVYGGYLETIQCVESVINAKNKAKYRLVVVYDCGPDKRLATELERLSKEYNFEFYPNDVNKGFVFSANKGIDMYPECDVILLNADTLVSDWWIDALVKAANTDQFIGTVTPTSNNATLYGYPVPGVVNDFPKDIGMLSKVNEQCQLLELNVVDIPSAHGFCMYLKRTMLDEVGGFDEQLWGRGYGEENDLSMRAASLGWRNVVTFSSFVYHHGSVSFAGEAQLLQIENAAKLSKLYPEYGSLVQDFIDNNVLRHTRVLLGKRLLQELWEPMPSILIVTHNFGGGTKVATDGLVELLNSSGQRAVILNQNKDGLWRFIDTVSGVVIDFDFRQEYEDIKNFLACLNVVRIDYHHIAQFDLKVLALPADTGTPYVVQIHDYLYACPRLSMYDSAGKYCSEPDSSAGCNGCIKKNGFNDAIYLSSSVFNDDIECWRNSFRDFLVSARRIFVPDVDVSKRLLRYFPLENLNVLPHIDRSADVDVVSVHGISSRKVNIAIVGSLGVHKGFYRVCRLVGVNGGRTLNIKIIGETVNDDFLRSHGPVDIKGKFSSHQLPDLLQDIDVVLFPGECVETYSYTLSEVIALGKRVVALDIGAIGSRLRKLGSGLLLPLSIDDADIITQIVEYASKDFSNSGVFLGARASDYIARYLEGLGEFDCEY
ncbi:glycosyltransferase [Oceanobacter mangrovi]|uniref:glycosyltransferase n=1 Tax=Oceanobacter mangrovi TaxID=2862510 RepID=UPI001C8D0547|nr:glycosyltransferase [Oceanobacter mangrovi]